MLSLALIVTVIIVYHLGWWALWDTGCQNRNLVKYERELTLKRAQERLHESEWERQMNESREQERLRETQREKREIEWERHMTDSQEQERLREAQRKQHEIEWERQMNNKRQYEHTREAEWHMSQEQRERLGLSWGEPLAGSCISYGVRSYRARLLDAAGSYSYNPIVPCREMPLDILGVSMKASFCESQGKVRFCVILLLGGLN